MGAVLRLDRPGKVQVDGEKEGPESGIAEEVMGHWFLLLKLCENSSGVTPSRNPIK
jgi:hypothetical protein